MAITYYASKGSNNSSANVLNNPVGTVYAPTQEKEENVGGFIGGVGYLGEKLAVGTVSSIEGIVDYLGSGFAKLFGRDDWAENIIANDWFGDWYSHPEEWYNPSQGWQVAGDVAGGIGTSIPGMAASIGAAVLTGGSSLVAQGVATAGASFLTSGLGAAGRSTKEAYQQSGELTGKEFGYGALSGLTEGGIEAVSNLIGMGSGAVVKSFTKALGKETAEAFTKQGIVKTLGKSFLGEAFEESASEILDPYWKRLTYDPNAKNATADEVLYAGFVGGLSGMVMGGTSYGIDATRSYIGGNRLAQRGGEAEVLDTAADLAAFENENQTGDELFTEIVGRREELAKSLEATGGKATTVLQQRELGALERANVAATAKMFVARRAQNIVNNVDLIVEKINSYGYKKADGTPITYTREQILEGYDPKRPQTIYKALKDNATLRSLAVADATGRLIMDTAKFKETTLTGQMLASQVDLNRFVETATPQEIAAVSKALGIEKWSDLTAEEFNQKIAEFVENGGVERSVQENERKKRFEAIGTEKAQGVPRIVNLGKDGVRRYTDGKLDIGVERRGDEYTVYDYNNKTLSRSMSREEVNSVFREYAKRNAGESSADIAAVTPESREHAAKVEEIKKFQSDVREIDKLARDKVKGYSKLSDASKGMIRKLIREGRAKGVPEADILMYASVSARSGIDIQFDKEACYRGVKEDGSPDYADGFYEASQNRIVVNPDGKRSAERLIIHELDHAIRKFFDKKGKKATRIYFEAIEGVSSEVREKIAKEYKKTAKPGEAAALVMDETNAYYAEQVLGNKYTLEKLLEEEPTLKEKILSFFKGAGKDYADVPKLAGAAKKYYRTYKKLFDEFSARNAENNAIEKPLTSMRTENMQDSGKQYTFKGVAEDGKSKYESNFPKGTPKSAKSERILDYITNVWSKKPINLVISNGETSRTITAQFDPTLDPSGNEPTDASKIAGGNRHGSASEKRVTLDLADDYYQIASEAKYNYSKEEIGKDSETHKDVMMWHYFVDDIYFSEHGESNYTPYTVTVNVKEKTDGTFVYSFNAEKTEESSTRRTLHAGVNTRKGANGELFIDSIPQSKEKSNSFDKNSSDRQDARQYAVSLDEDNNGRKLTSEQAEYFRDSKARDKHGRLLVLYHGTNANFYTFKKGDVGFHFGTKGAARGRAGYGKNAIIKEVYLRITNPISFDEDLGSWDADYRLTQELFDRGILNKAEAENVLMTDNKSYKRTTEAANKKLAELLVSKGYDGIEYKNTFETKNPTTSYIVFNSNQAKDITNNAPTTNPDIRYALDIDSEGESISGAEAKKPKGKTIGKAKGKTKAQVRAEQVAENTKIRTKAEYTTDKVFSQASVKRGFDSIEAVKKLPSDVREDIARKLWIELEMSEGDEVRDTFALKYSVELYQAIREANPEEYENMSPKQRDELQSRLRETVREIAKSGKESKLSKMQGDVREAARAEERIGTEIKSQIYQNLKKIDDKKKRRFIEASAYKGDLFKGTLDSLTKIDWRGKFSSNIARAEIKKLAEWYNEDNPMLKGFETKDENSKKTVTTNFSRDIKGMLEILSQKEGEFTNEELKMLSDITGYFSKLVNEYDRVYIEGRWQDGEPLAKKMVQNIKQQDSVGVPVVIRAMRNKLLSLGFRTFGDALSVMKLADMYGEGIYTKYYNEWVQAEINADAEAMKIKEKYDAFIKDNPKYLKKTANEVVKLHDINVSKIDLIGYAMTLKRKQSWESIAEGGVVFADPESKADNHIYPTSEVTKGKGYSKRLEQAMQAELDNVMALLSEKDLEYMKVLEEGFELARITKAMGDIQRLGYASVIDGYYYPIKHAYTDHLSSFEAELIATDKYANASFNKNQIEGAKSAIRIGSADAAFNSHVKGVSRYLYLSPVMDSFNKLYKLKISESGFDTDIIKKDGRQKTYSLQSTIAQSKTAWRDDGKLVGFDYLQNLMLDTMGMGKNVGDDFFSQIRGASVTFSLGANPKVLVTQLSSLISSTSILSWGSHARAIGIWNGNDVDNYSTVAKLRNNDSTVAKAEGVVDKINTFTRIFTAGISLMDRFVVTRVWAACQTEVAQNGGPAVGTEENRIEAGKLLDKVILETQQNSLTSRRTEGARRGNILTKSVQMYKSDAITIFGRAFDGWGEMNYLKAMLKSEKLSDSERASVEKRLGEAKKSLVKSVAAIGEQAVFMLLITEMFRNFYGKNDDETEEERKNRIVVDAVGNVISGIPVLSEVWSTLTSNFGGFDSMEFSALNEFFDTAKGVAGYAEKVIEGKATERDSNKMIQDVLYSAGQLVGVPTRNMKNVTYGVVRLFSKDAAYKWDNALYKKNYSSDLNKAVENGDIDRATMIMELALGEKLGSRFSTEAISELTRLAALSEKVTPSAISDSITVNGEELVLDANQYTAVKSEYRKVIQATSDFVESKFYQSLTDTQKAKALRKLYATYKDIAYDTVLGTERNKKAGIMSKLFAGDVFNAYLSLGVIDSDVDDEGNTVSGSKRVKVVSAINSLKVSSEQKLLLICASGYSIKDGDIRGVGADVAKTRLLKYILNLKGLSAEEKAEVAEMCGFEVKNGKIVNNFSKKVQKFSKK